MVLGFSSEFSAVGFVFPHIFGRISDILIRKIMIIPMSSSVVKVSLKINVSPRKT